MDTSKPRIPFALAVGAGVLAVATFAVLFVFEAQLRASGEWLPYLVVVPIYIPLQLFAEGVLEVFWSRGSWVGKAFPVVILVGFYVSWFALTVA